MQIKCLSLFNKKGERRDIQFNLSKVNIITGASKKGKSALIDIIEYCLGSSECNIAEGCIKQTVSWFSILLSFSDVEVFIARKTPKEGSKSNTLCNLIISEKVVIPQFEDLNGTSNVDSVVSFLTSKLGIAEQLTEIPEEQTRSKINISFKHSLFYLFQTQGELAAKHTLFHRQSEPYIPQMIKDTIPYFLGAAEDDRLSEIEYLRQLKRQRSKLIRQIDEIESIKGAGLKKGYSLLAEAKHIGLYNGIINLSDDNLLNKLREITSWRSEKDDIPNSEDILYSLEKKYKEASETKKRVRAKIRAAEEYSGSINGFERETTEQSLRLQSIGLYKNLKSDIDEESVDTIFDKKIESIMLNAIESLNSKIKNITRNKPRITTYLKGLRDEDHYLANYLTTLRNQINNVRREELNTEKSLNINERRAWIIGRISLYLESINISDNSILLKEKLDIFNKDIELLEKKLDPNELKERIESQLSCIALDMTKWAQELKLEHSEHPIRLDANKLTVVAEMPQGRTPLFRMGSGENWVGYHLVAYLALAKWFIEQDRPVGHFLFLDQPTQVYFPSDSSSLGLISELKDDEDRQAVRRMFQWVIEVVNTLTPNLQVIITDHADIDESWFQDLVIDEKWRGEKALIPKHWYEQE